MNCKAVQASLSAFIDREVGPIELMQIRAHLADCAVCGREEQDLRCLKSLLSGIPTPEPDAAFEARLLSGIHRPAERRMVVRGSRVGSVALYASVAAISMAVTLQYLAVGHGPAEVAQQSHDLSADVRRDQVWEAGASEPRYGAPVIMASDSWPKICCKSSGFPPRRRKFVA